jgi:hypothetical protein
LFFFVERILLLIKTDDFSLGLLLRYLNLFFLILKYFLFNFKGFLFENFRYSVDLANIAGLALTNTLGILYVFSIAWSDILLLILFITSIRGYISFISFGYRVTKRNRTTIVIFR